MPLARLVVIEGPDLGVEFEIPLRGGGIGRGDDNLVQLSDPSVSRQHCGIELRDGVLCVVDDASRNRTLVNGQPVAIHALAAGDEIVVGKTRLAFVPADGGIAVTAAGSRTPGRVTIEVGSRELMALVPGRDDPARRHLAALAALGDRLRVEASGGRDAVARVACDSALAALAADRAVLVVRDGGRMTPLAGASAAGEAPQLTLPREVVDKVLAESKAVTVEPASGGGARAGLAVPVADVALLWVERRAGGWDHLDLMAAQCLAHLLAAALAGADARDQLQRGKAALEDRLGDADFVGRSPAAARLLDFVARVGPTDATVLLGGESGSGKEMVSRAIHRASRRRAGPCVAVNCAALTETLIESELFGHEKGAFTGATDRKLGRFELADKGTLFLDEIGELPLALQTKFLRVLEEQRFERVGGQRPIAVDVRVVAATNRDLTDMVRRGTFREDLYYRLSVIHAVVPPLRARPEDIPLLADHFLARARGQVSRRIRGFSPEAIRLLEQHAWPGNVRELRNAVEYAVVLGDGEWLRPEHLPANLGARAAAPARRRSSPTPPLGSMAIVDPALARVRIDDAPVEAPAAAIPAASPAPAGARSLRELERDGIVAALAQTSGNKAQAAAILEIDRSTLYKKLKEYGIG
jgi:DNA-binding NtrC family response regulator